MNTASSRHLSHDFPAYKGLTLRELMIIVSLSTAGFFFLSLLAGLIFGWLVAFACLGFLFGFIVAITLVPKPVARLKAGKPHGYLMKKVQFKLAAIGLKQVPYLKHRGLWQKTRRIRGFHV